MKKIASFITKKKIWVIVFFLAASIASAFFVGKVKINYDISKYLSSESETSLALKIVEDEFGDNGNMQVMVSGVDEDTSNNIKEDIEEVNYVLAVNYDSTSENYFKDNNALYVLIIDGDDYSEHARSVSNDVQALLKNYETYYGGTAVDKQRLQDAIQSEMVYIIVAAVFLASGILLLTSESWVEPLLLLGTAGVAILVNLGTNAFFPSISYITNSISAILQLALSIDYSIVLLNTYRKNKGELGNEEAMKKAVVEVVKPVSASGLTTLAGLCALLFMSYRIGFDIGIVLMKGIVISLITSLTLLPGVILFCDKLLTKTHKKSIKFSGSFFTNIASKGSKIIVPIGLVLISACAALNFSNTYTYSNQSNVDAKIAETFGQNNQFMVVFPKEKGNYENQEAFIGEIKEFKDKDGVSPFVNYSSYTNTVLESYDEEKIEKNLEISQDEAEMLLTLYNLNQNPDRVKLTFTEMVNYSDLLLNSDADAKEFADESTKKTIEKLVAVEDLLTNENTSSELYRRLSDYPLNEMTGEVDSFSIDELYGLYFYESLADDKVLFNTMLDYVCYVAENVDAFSSAIDETTLSSLKLVSANVNESVQNAITPMSQIAFRGYMYQTYGTVVSEQEAAALYQAYFQTKGMEEEETIPYLDLMEFLVTIGKITDETSVSQIQNARAQYNLVTASYPYDEFLSILGQVIYASTGSVPTMSVTNSDIKMIYVSYFDQAQAFDTLKIKGSDFVSYVKRLYENDEYMKGQIGESLYEKICDLDLINAHFNDMARFNYADMYAKLNSLKDSLHVSLDVDELNEDMISGVYVKYEISHDNALLNPVAASDLLAFVNENKDSNTLLIKKLDEEKLIKIDDSNAKLETAESLFKGKNYYRLLISMDLTMEGEDTERFVTYLKKTATKYFGENSYIAGESVSTNDLKQSFATDQIIISVVTVVSILLIVAFTFKSASLPFILVLVIQGACWIAFSINHFTGPVFFMSYIIASCILMGATVDYGILMSTNYLENRKTMEKKDALQLAIKRSLPTIFTSGLILTVCGFTICFISSQASISSVGLLVGEGTLAAIFLILFLLPSLLYLLDKVILKTTYRKKDKSN